MEYLEFILINQKKKKFKNLLNDIKLFSELSIDRGQDTFGLAFSTEYKEYVYKVNTHPLEVFKRKDFKEFTKPIFEEEKIGNIISIIGQTRLVTNGTKFLATNNQPILSKNIIGVHNGIIVDNEPDLLKKNNQEGYNVKSDSLLLFENLSEYFSENSKNFIVYLNDYLKNIDGNYSIAFRIPCLKLSFLSSNCGSLYYLKTNNFLIFASEKKILENFSLKSKLDLDFTKLEIKKIINNLLIFDDNLNFVNEDENYQKKNKFNE